MNYIFDKVSQIEFEENNSPILFGTPDTDKVFATISKDDRTYKFCWKSELIDPIIKEWDGVNFLIGVDLYFIIFNIKTGEIINRFEFDSFFCDLQFYDGIFYIVTQLEVFRLSALTFKIIDSYSLPDIFDRIVLENDYIIIICFGGERILIPRTKFTPIF